MAFLNETGLEQVWSKIKAKISSIEGTISDINEAKVDKVSGKGLSTNDYTTAEKEKLAGIATGATKVIVDSELSSISTNAIQNKVVMDMKTNIENELSNKLSNTGEGANGTWGISISGNAETATKLATARTIQTNLGSTSSADFDGTGNISPGVIGTLTIANGGTGATTAETAKKNLGIDYAAGQEYYTATFDGTDTLYSSYSCNLYSVTVDDGKIPLDLTGVEPIGLSLIVAFENSSEASSDNYIALRINGSNYYIVGGRNYAGGSFITKVAQPFLNNPCRIEFALNSGFTTDSVWHGLWAVPGGYSNYTLGGTGFSSAVAVSKGGTGATSKSGARTNLGITSGTSLPSTGSEGDIFFLY